MKTLYLVRHAEAVSKKKNIPDFERSLVPRGVKEARRIARRFVKADGLPDLLVSSPANRAIETAHIFAGAMDYDIEKVLLKPEIYEARDDNGLMQTVTSIQDDCNTVALFGHDPSLTSLASRILPGFDGPVPKGGVVGVTFDVDSWRSIPDRPGHAAAFFFPMSKTEKDHALAALRNSLEEDLRKQLRGYFAALDTSVVDTLGKTIDKLATRTVAALFKEMRKKDLLQLYWKHTAPKSEVPGDRNTAGE